ncbi:MAG: hypothetical protein REH83_06825 [Rickettsiella sp.]|nr:hypothetical protein [Rickettsiella sp.]
MRYFLNPELNAQLKKKWDKIGLSKEIQDSLINLMDIAVIAIEKDLAVLPDVSSTRAYLLKKSNA